MSMALVFTVCWNLLLSTDDPVVCGRMKERKAKTHGSVLEVTALLV